MAAIVVAIVAVVRVVVGVVVAVMISEAATMATTEVATVAVSDTATILKAAAMSPEALAQTSEDAPSAARAPMVIKVFRGIRDSVW